MSVDSRLSKVEQAMRVARASSNAGYQSSIREFVAWVESCGPASEAAFWRIARREFLDTAEGVTPAFLGRFVPLMASDYFPKRLSAIECPTLMVVPDPDPMVEAHEYESMRKYLNHCRFVSVPGAGHSMVGEIPDRCALEAKRFLDDVRAGRAL